MTETELKRNTAWYTLVDLLQDEVHKEKAQIPPSFDSIAEFLAISRPIVELILMNCGDWTDQIEHRDRGKPPISHVSLMLIHILSKMLGISYRQIERELRIHDTWLKALKLKKAPSHSRLSTFRTELGESFFQAFFSNLTALLHRFDLIQGDEAIIDSAPIIASMNFARVNTKPQLNLDHVKAFFTAIDVSPATCVLRIFRKSKYNPESFIRFFMFEKLGGFLSTSQALKFLNNYPEVVELLGFKNGHMPDYQNFTYFKRKHGAVSELLEPLVDAVTEFFELSKATPEASDIDFFFWRV
ncbi:MAG: transposase [Promethearchaeota archaeon]